MKIMSSIGLLLTIVLSSSAAFAMSDDKLISTCMNTGKERLEMHGDALRCKLVGEIEASAIDNRWYNPSKYIWYIGTFECADGHHEIEKMIQYYAGECI